MPEINQDLITVVKELGRAVAELPESVQERAFEVLLERHLRLTGLESGPIGGLAREPEEDWRAVLAREAGVTHDEIAALLNREGEDVYVVTPELGDTGASRTRNIAVLVLWATRVLTRDIYAPQSLVYAALRRHKLPTQNVTNYLRGEPCIRSVHVAGQRVFQLVGDWKKRAAEVIRQFAGA